MVKPSADYRRKEIIDATLKAIDKVGLSRISYDLIAEEAGTSRQLIRHYYPDIEPLMVDIVESVARAYRRTMAEDTSPTDNSDRLSQMMDFFFDRLTGAQLPPTNSFDAMFTLANNSNEIKRAMRATHQELTGVFQTELKRRYPDLHDNAYTELGHLFISVMTGHWRMVETLGMSADYTPVARHAMDRLIESYVEQSKG